MPVTSLLARTPAPSQEPPPTVNAFTQALTDLCREHGVAIEGGVVVPMDMSWNGPDAEKWEQYATDDSGALLRGFWNQAPTVA